MGFDNQEGNMFRCSICDELKTKMWGTICNKCRAENEDGKRGSRLDEECIMAVVRNRSGIDAGEIDYSLSVDKFDRMSIGCLQDALRTLRVLREKCEERILELEKKEQVAR